MAFQWLGQNGIHEEWLAVTHGGKLRFWLKFSILSIEIPSFSLEGGHTQHISQSSMITCKRTRAFDHWRPIFVVHLQPIQIPN